MTPSPKSRHRWTLLVVRDDGRMVPIRHAKGGLVLLTLVLTAALVVVSGLVWSYRLKQDRCLRLRAELDELHLQVQNLETERDLLMGRLAVLQARKTGPAASKPPPADAAASDANVAVVPVGDTAGDGPEAADAAASSPAPPDPRPVAVEEFRLSRDGATDRLRVQFKLINVDPDEDPVSGHTFVVFKNENLDEAGWLSLPKVPLKAGRPTVPGRGRYFAIARFNTVRLTVDDESKVDRLHQATVFVYDEQGTLLLAKDFAVQRPTE